MSLRRIDVINNTISKINNEYNVYLTYYDYGEYKLLKLNGSVISKPIKSLRELEKACFLVQKVLENHC